METVSFTRMEDGTHEEYTFLGQLWNTHHYAALADNVLGLLKGLEGPKLGYQIDRYQHSLQSATRALRDEADEETVVCALLHDMGDTLAPDNHSEFAAAILRPYVSQANHWIVKHHGVFQGYYYWHHVGRDRDARERYRGHPSSRPAPSSARAGTRTASTRNTTPCRSSTSSPWCAASSRSPRAASTEPKRRNMP